MSSSKSLASESSLIVSLSHYIQKLNHEEGALVVVEGVRDAKALRDSGFDGEIFMLCHKQNVSKLEARAVKFKKTILLLDNDAEGRRLASRTQRILRGRVKLDLFYQKELLPASKGKIRHVEEFATYSDRLAVHIG